MIARIASKLLSRRIAALAGALAIAAVLYPGKPALAQYSYYYPYPGYYRAYPYQYYQPYPNYQPWYYDPYGHTLLNDPNHPCVWEGRGCPIVH